LSVEIVLDRDLWTTQRHGLGFTSSSMDHDDQDISLFEVLPRDDTDQRSFGSSSSPSFGFTPNGGVTSLSTFRMPSTASGGRGQETDVAFVWIAYRDGTLVRLHHAGLFPSVWQRGADEGRSLEDILGIKALVRCKVHLPSTLEAGLQVQPLARYFPSPLAPLPLWKTDIEGASAMDEQLTSPDLSSDEDIEEEEEEEDVYKIPEGYEALVFGCGSDTDSDRFPTLCFYTSEDHLFDRVKRDQGSNGASAVVIPGLGAVVGGTKALVGGVLGSALRWGFGARTASAAESTPDESENAMEESVHEEGSLAPFPSLWRMPIGLFAANELHDMPRKVESCSVDPDGRLAAVTDGLGRVLLIDLSTKQIVRLWKGFRDASCYWIQAPRSGSDENTFEKPAIFLVIHSRQRRVVEVWHARHGSRLCSVQVGRDAQVVPCSLGLHLSWASCYLVHSNVLGASFNQTEKIKVDGLESLGTSDSESRRRKAAAKVSSTPSSRDAALRFQHLQQLLSTTNVQCYSQDVYTALQQITSLADLAAGLDLLAGASVLEQKMGVQGSEFQKMAVAHCKEYLEKATKGNEKDAGSNPNVQLLKRKIDFHSQV
jgi:hypothetical protein